MNFQILVESLMSTDPTKIYRFQIRIGVILPFQDLFLSVNRFNSINLGYCRYTMPTP